MELQELINHLQELSPKPFKEKDVKICSYLYKCACNNNIADLSVRKCANYLKISSVSLVRFGKKIGFNGFNDTKLYIVNIISGKNSFSKQQEINDYTKMIHYLSQKNIELNALNFNNLAELLISRKKILIYGEGISNLIARYFAIQLGKIGIIINNIDLVSSEEREAADLKNSDGIILVSQSGETDAVINKAKKAHNLHLPIVSLTTHQPNSLANISDINIKIIANNYSSPKLHTINYNSMIFFIIDFFIQQLLFNSKQ
ncbi:MAG: MurR/RpiR family transcriptional regulator [Alphaproteobacteria bacterium]|nr:MurR/RpiR family transcriptional regulator [Alphaproteobacteria bacterium]